MPLLDNELARRADGGLSPDASARATNGDIEIRPTPLRVRWRLVDLSSSDGHELRCDFECSVRALPDPTERRMLREVLLQKRSRATDVDVAAHFARALQAAAAKTAKAHPASDWVHGADGQGPSAAHGALTDALVAAAGPVAFACGVEVLPPYRVELDSPSFRQQRVRDLQRAAAERHAKGQMEQLQRAGELLKQFESLRQSAPQLSAGGVLERVSPADRGSMLQTLLLASAARREAGERGQDLWAVAGPYLVRIDANSKPAATDLTPLPPTLGPLRSVQAAKIAGENVLLVGARSGFMLVRPAGDLGRPEAYEAPAVESQYGFSAVVHCGEGRGFAGCHAEAGIVRWDDGHMTPRVTIAPSQLSNVAAASSSSSAGPRNLQTLDHDSLVFSVGSRVCLMGADNAITPLAPQSPADVAAIVPDERQLVIVHEDGTICLLDRETRQMTCHQRTGLRLCAAGSLPWLGGVRLLLAVNDGPVQCVGLDDPLVTQYTSPHRGPRVVAGSAEFVAAVSTDRQRLIVWNSWDGRQPLAEVYLTGLTRHRVADIDFG